MHRRHRRNHVRRRDSLRVQRHTGLCRSQGGHSLRAGSPGPGKAVSLLARQLATLNTKGRFRWDVNVLEIRRILPPSQQKSPRKPLFRTYARATIKRPTTSPADFPAGSCTKTMPATKKAKSAVTSAGAGLPLSRSRNMPIMSYLIGTCRIHADHPRTHGLTRCGLVHRRIGKYALEVDFKNCLRIIRFHGGKQS